MSKALAGAGHALVAVQDNLIDAVWQDRPPRPSTQLITLGLDRTGECCPNDESSGFKRLEAHDMPIYKMHVR